MTKKPVRVERPKAEPTSAKDRVPDLFLIQGALPGSINMPTHCREHSEVSALERYRDTSVDHEEGFVRGHEVVSQTDDDLDKKLSYLDYNGRPVDLFKVKAIKKSTEQKSKKAICDEANSAHIREKFIILNGHAAVFFESRGHEKAEENREIRHHK